MRGLLLASVAMMAGPTVPPMAPPPADKPPCADQGKAPQPLRPDKPSDAQRFNPGLF